MYIGDLLNPAVEYSVCGTCGNKMPARATCIACFGSGKVCRSCLNNGHAIKTGHICSCGILQQGNMFVEFNTMAEQHLVELPGLKTGESKYEVVSPFMEKLYQKNYKIEAMDNVYSRFAFIFSQPQRLMRWRVNAYNKLIRNGMPAEGVTIAHRCFLYINAAELNSQTYLDFINKYLTLRKTAILVFMGLSNLLPPYTYPFLPMISTNMANSMLFFSDLGWLNHYGFLNINLIDGKQDENDDNPVPLDEEVFQLVEQK